MKLLDYLKQHFYSLQQLLELANIELSDFRHFQGKNMMPKCSYKCVLNVGSQSYFGEHKETYSVEYYAKSYVEWLAAISDKDTQDEVFSLFDKRYRQQLSRLKVQGYQSHFSQSNAELSVLISEDWEHFLSGTYGLCTKSGLPEDIATKEITITIIESLERQELLSVDDRQHLRSAINLLDQACALFAPHERPKSSRYRLIEQVRKKYDF